MTYGPVINAKMRRIDLICKLMGPLLIALIDGISTEVAILFNLAVNSASVIVEYPAIVKVDSRSLVFAILLSHTAIGLL